MLSKEKKRNFISASSHVSFCLSYKHNSPSLTRKVDFIKEWNKGIDNFLRSQDENISWITTKTNNGPNFQYRKLSVIKLVLTDGRNLSGSVHTWCPSTSTRAPAQNGAVFRHTVPSLKICSHSINRAHAHYWNLEWDKELWVRKQVVCG